VLYSVRMLPPFPRRGKAAVLVTMLRQTACSMAGHLRLRIAAVPPPAMLLALRGEKTTTGIVGLDFDPDARENLVKACEAVLASVQTLIPEGTAYRKNVETAVNYKLKVLEANAENGAAEEVLGFQLEEEIKACQKELTLIPKMAEWKPWETDKPEVEEVAYGDVDDAMKKYGY